MADQEQEQEQEVSAEVIAEATSHGWTDREHFKGDPDKFVDAKTFLERGQTFIPFLKAEAARTRAALAAEQQARLKLEGDLAASRKSIEALNKLNEEDRAADIEAAKKEVKEQIAQAVKDGNTEVLGDLTEQLVKLATPPAVIEEEEEDAPDPNKDTPTHPDFAPWVVKNPWFGKDAYRSDLAMAEAKRLLAAGEPTRGMAFFDKVAAGVDKIINPRATRSRVESGDLGGGSAGGGSSGYDSLPAEAKAECDREAKSRVGKDKRYKTPAEWRERYAETYFQQPGTRQ